MLKDCYCDIYIYIYIYIYDVLEVIMCWWEWSDRTWVVNKCGINTFFNVIIHVIVSVKWWYWIVNYELYNYITIRPFNMSFWDYEIVIEIEYKWQVDHVLICEILNCGHGIWLWISVWLILDVILLVLWILNYTITRLVFSLRKVFMHEVLKEKYRVPS